MKGQLGLVVATEIEHRAAASVLKRLPAGHRIDLIKTGIGAIGFEEKFSVRLAAVGFDAIIISGLCGALTPELKKGDVIVYDWSRTTESVCELDRSLSDTIAASLPCVRGTGLTVTRVITEATEKAILRREYGAFAVDMETFAVAAVCQRMGIPVAALRVVSDEAHQDLPDFNRWLGPNGEVVGWQIPRTLLGRPRATWRIVSSFKPIMKSYRDALEKVLTNSGF